MCQTSAIAVSLFALVALAAGPAGAEQPKGGGKTDPPGAPLELRLISKKASYPLDLGGQTAEAFRKQLREAETSGKVPPPPAVQLVLELRNTSDKDIQVQLGGDNSVLLLNLKGPGAVSIEPRRAFTREFRIGRPVTIAPGKSTTIPVNSLSYGFRMQAKQAYWVEPGEYTLSASYRLPVAPAPKGAEDAGDGFGIVTVTSAPVKIRVEAK
jgi:hypothetical protein